MIRATHLLDRAATRPLCRDESEYPWNYTVAAQAVSCPRCLRLLAEARALPGAEGPGAAHRGQ